MSSYIFINIEIKSGISCGQPSYTYWSLKASLACFISELTLKLAPEGPDCSGADMSLWVLDG